MSNFNFNSFASVKPANTTSYLQPYTICDNVTIKSTSINEGTTSDGKTWKSLVITFGNDDGIYNDSTFFLDINDPKVTERRIADMPSGGKREMPSTWEQTYYKLAAIGHAFASEYIDKFNSVVGKCKTFEEFIKAYKSMLDKVIGKTTTSMKLVGRNSNGHIYASLPNCVGIAQATDDKKAMANNVEKGQWYTWMTSPFGNNLSFSPYEQSKRNEITSAKPSDMNQIIETTTNETDDEIDFDSLL